MRSVCKTALIAVLCLLLCTASALADGGVTVSADFGYDGAVTYLSAMPLRVTLKNDGADTELTVAIDVDRSSSEYDTYEYPLSLASGAEKQLVIPIMLNYKQKTYTVRVTGKEGLIASVPITPKKVIAPTTLLVGVLSDSPQTLNYLNIGTANDQLMRGEVWQTIALTQDTFPDSYELMRAFSFLAVDGVDISQFSDAQRQALETWLKNGGVAIVGGGTRAVSAYRGFAGMTGITTGAPYSAQGAAQALVDALSDTQFPLTESAASAQGTALLSPINGDLAQQIAALDGKTLIARSQVGSGLVYTTAFSLSEKPLSGWKGMSCFWQRVLLSTGASAYQNLVDSSSNYYRSSRDYYTDTSMLTTLGIANDESMIYPMLAIAVFLLLAGAGSYLLLKRLDKREWMWLTVPVLSACCVGVLSLMGSRMQLNKPAATAYSIYNISSDGRTSSATMAGVAIAQKENMTVSTRENALVEPSNTYYSYYEEDDDTKTYMHSLRYLYTLGEKRAVTFPAAGAWEVQLLYIQPEENTQLNVSASIWWEDDGLHGEIVNNSDYTLDAGYVLTMYGYCTTPRILPGQTAKIAIVENPSRKEGGAYDGEMINEKLSSSMSYIDNIIYAALHPFDPQATYDNSNHYQTMTTDEINQLNLRSTLISAVRSSWYGSYRDYNDKSLFRYITFNDTLGDVQLTVNGTDVERTAHCAIIDVQIKYVAVSETGHVKVPAGITPYELGALDSQQRPYSLGVRSSSSYFMLRDEPVLCFSLGQVDGVDVSRLTLTSLTLDGQTYGSGVVVRIYDQQAQAWDTVNSAGMPMTLSEENLGRYMDAQGNVFVRASQQGGRDGELDTPSLAFEGKVN